jgi:hypothetical protein
VVNMRDEDSRHELIGRLYRRVAILCILAVILRDSSLISYDLERCSHVLFNGGSDAIFVDVLGEVSADWSILGARPCSWEACRLASRVQQPHYSGFLEEELIPSSESYEPLLLQTWKLFPKWSRS